MWVPKLLLTPIKIRILAQKRPKFVQNMHFWLFWAKYCHFLHILSNARPKTNLNKVPRWVFRYVGNKTFDFSSKKRIFLPKNDQIWSEIGISAHCWLIWCPVGGLAGGCGAGCISLDTYLLYLLSLLYYQIFLDPNLIQLIHYCVLFFSLHMKVSYHDITFQNISLKSEGSFCSDAV